MFRIALIISLAALAGCNTTRAAQNWGRADGKPANGQAMAKAYNECLIQMQHVSTTQPLPDYVPNRSYSRPYHRGGGFDVSRAQNAYEISRASALRDQAVAQRNNLMQATFISCMRSRGYALQ